MNDDYAHLLPLDLKFDFVLLGRAVKAAIADQGLTLADVERQTRVSRASVSRITTNLHINMVPVLRLCIWMDVNPFEFVRPMGELPHKKVFHGNTPLKLSENTRENLETSQ